MSKNPTQKERLTYEIEKLMDDYEKSYLQARTLFLGNTVDMLDIQIIRKKIKQSAVKAILEVIKREC